MSDGDHELIVYVKEPADGSFQAPVAGVPVTVPKMGGEDDPTGHAFLELKDPDGNSRVVGFYPGEPLSAANAFSSVKGALNNDQGHEVTEAATTRYKISKEQYDQMVAEVDRWDAAPPKYNLVSNNCTSFVRKVAAAGGVRTPPLPDTPRSLSAGLRAGKAIDEAVGKVADYWSKIKAKFSSASSKEVVEKCAGKGTQLP